VKDDPELRDLENVIMAVQLACKTISNLVHRAGLVYSIQNEVPDGGDNSSSNGSDSNNSAEDYDDSSASLYSDGRYYSMKRLDKLSTAVLKNALKFTGDVKMIVPEAKEIREQPGQHQPGVLIAYDDHNLVCLDPLDGSGNADASICTGTVFGIFSKEGQQDETSCGDINGHQSNRGGEEKRSNIVLEDEASLLEAVLQPARKMRAAGYCLYSSATVLVFSLGSSVYGMFWWLCSSLIVMQTCLALALFFFLVCCSLCPAQFLFYSTLILSLYEHTHEQDLHLTRTVNSF
jgi:fructose-1,6-bisphosphatase I